MAITHPYVALHYDLMERADEEKDLERKKALLLEDVSIFEDFVRDYKSQVDEEVERSMYMGHLIGEKYPLKYYKEKRAWMYNVPRYSSFKALAIIYEKEGDFAAAIDICRIAIKVGQTNDGTKGGMSGRLEKLLAKQKKKA